MEFLIINFSRHSGSLIGGQEMYILSVLKSLETENSVKLFVSSETEEKKDFIFRRNPYFLSFFKEIFFLRKLFKRKNKIIINESRGALAVFLASLFLKKEIFYIRHDIYLSPYMPLLLKLRKKLYLTLDKLIFKKVKIFICYCESVKEELIKNGVNAEKIKKVYPYFEFDEKEEEKQTVVIYPPSSEKFKKVIDAVLEFTGLNKKNKPSEKIKKENLIFFPARSDIVKKGIDAAFFLAEYIKRKGIDFKIIYAGTGKDINKIKRKIKKSGLTRVFLIKGFLKKEEVFNLYKKSRITFLPSRYEGFGFVFLEALFLSGYVLASEIKPFIEIQGFFNKKAVFFNVNDNNDLTRKFDFILTLPCESQKEKSLPALFSRTVFEKNTKEIFFNF